MSSTALLTDQYELTMLDAALTAGVADRPVVFEVFTRALPAHRRYGVFAGLGRLLDALEHFRFGPEEVEWLAGRGFLSEATLDWIGRYRFSGDIDAYEEGELYTAGSPVITVSGRFGEAVLLETLVLSIINHDSAVASAASLVTAAAGDRPVIEMGSRRTDPEAAVAAARAAYIGGLASTSNLEAGRRYGIPTAGTSAHAFTLLFEDEGAAFAAQVATLGTGTTLLVDTYDTPEGIRRAVAAAGAGLGAVRIDSGDLGAEAVRARLLLDSLGATSTRVIVTGDLDDAIISRLGSTPVDGYGVGTSVVMGGQLPTSGFVYKMVEAQGRAVRKKSPGKETFGGRKLAYRSPQGDCDVIAAPGGEDGPPGDERIGRPLQSRAVVGGVRRRAGDVSAARQRHASSCAELGSTASLTLSRLSSGGSSVEAG